MQIQPSLAILFVFYGTLAVRARNRTAGGLPDHGAEFWFCLIRVWHHLGQEVTDLLPAAGVRTGLVRPRSHEHPQKSPFSRALAGILEATAAVAQGE